MKTAALFAAATELGAFINEASPEIISAMKEFGLKLGTAYQIYDDCLDIAGSEDTVGKTLGTDLRKGKLTLPILHLLQSAPEQQRQSLSAAILRGNDGDIEELTAAARDGGAINSAIAAGGKILHEAREKLRVLEPNKYSAGLHDICESVEQMLAQFAV